MTVCCIRGQGVRVGNRFGVVHRFVSPSEVLVKFREGFETVPAGQLLPATETENQDPFLLVRRHRREETEFDGELGFHIGGNRDAELVPDVSEEEPEQEQEQEQGDREFDGADEMAEEMEEI